MASYYGTSSDSTATYTYYPSNTSSWATSTTNGADSWTYYPRRRRRTYKSPKSTIKKKPRSQKTEWKPLAVPEKVEVDVNINIESKEIVPDKPRTRIEEVDGRLVRRVIRCENCNGPQKEEEEGCPYCGI